ncbi:hypothetical protein [Halorhodospira halochloris]|uniref:hypothetical protein n=1 Tax=Halorhodospira halochloris TaxID=1052 RepID=UPI0013A5AC12|nr:hypothetical protein [Halorhodospira halochloris]
MSTLWRHCAGSQRSGSKGTSRQERIAAGQYPPQGSLQSPTLEPLNFPGVEDAANPSLEASWRHPWRQDLHTGEG